MSRSAAMPSYEEELQGSGHERGDGGGLLIVVDLGVGPATAVIHDQVPESPACSGRATGPIPGHGVPRLIELPELLGVHVQQIPRARPLSSEPPPDAQAGAGGGSRRVAAPGAPVESGRPSSSASRRGRPAAHGGAARGFRSSSSAGTRAGERSGRLERSCRQASDRRSRGSLQAPPATYPLPHQWTSRRSPRLRPLNVLAVVETRATTTARPAR